MHGGCDKGFCFIYWKLSYRRKFIRTLWVAALIALVVAVLVVTRPDLRTIPTAVLAVLTLVQATYNYRKWQAEVA